jgi:hypothetical protein
MSLPKANNALPAFREPANERRARTLAGDQAFIAAALPLNFQAWK